MRKGRRPHELTGLVSMLWLDMQREDPQVSARAVYTKMLEKGRRGAITERTVRSIVRRMERKRPGPEISRGPWKPWIDVNERPEETDCLLKLDLISRAELGRGLYQDEATWACRIRPAVVGLDPYYHWTLARQYAIREQMRMVLGKDGPGTAFLDALLAIKPWIPENRHVWRAAMSRGLVPESERWLYWTFDWPIDPDVYVMTLSALGLTDSSADVSFDWRKHVLHDLKQAPWNRKTFSEVVGMRDIYDSPLLTGEPQYDSPT